MLDHRKHRAASLRKGKQEKGDSCDDPIFLAEAEAGGIIHAKHRDLNNQSLEKSKCLE